MEQKRFISKISRIAQGYTMKALRGLDMNLSELHALRSITWLPGQSQTELSERLSVDKAWKRRAISAARRTRRTGASTASTPWKRPPR